MRLGILSVVIGIAVAAIAVAADELTPVKGAALLQYDQGNYEEALKTLHDLDNARALDGPLLYRLFFCEKAAGHPDEAGRALERARETLENELAAAKSLEVAFYLANTYSNLGRPADSQRLAREMTAEIEAGHVANPTAAIGLFQLGKLYQDQGNEREAAAAYQKAMNAFDLSGGRYAGNARWALRYLGSTAAARSDFESAESNYARLTSLGGSEATDWDALAAARTRLSKFGLAAEAWRASVKLDQANGDDARYAARLADIAGTIAPLPAAPKGGTPFATMGKAELEGALKSRAEVVIAAHARATEAMKGGDDESKRRVLDPKVRAELTESLHQVRLEFVAAGLEYALHHYGIRDTAFREGYAVLVFQDRAWELPPDPEAGS